MFAEGERTLLDVALPVIRKHFALRGIPDGPPDVPGLNWNPTRWFRTREGITYFVEASPDILVPQIVDLSHGQALQASEPISVLIVCSEQTYSSAQLRHKEQKKEQGYGFLVVDASSKAVVDNWGKPLIQVISNAEFETHLQAARNNVRLPQSLRGQLNHAYDRYRDDSVSGVKAISEVVEALGVRLHEDLLPAANVRQSFASRMNDLMDDSRFRSQRAALAGARNYVDTRNTAAHAPRNRSQRYQRAQLAKVNFLNGVRHACETFRAAKALGASGSI